MKSKMDRLRASIGNIIFIHDEIYWSSKSGIAGAGSWDGIDERTALLIDVIHQDDWDELTVKGYSNWDDSTVDGYSVQYVGWDSFLLVLLIEDVIRRVIINEDFIFLQDGDSVSPLRQ